MHQKRHRSRADSIHHRWRQIRLQIGNLQAALPSSPCRRAVVALRMKTGASLQLERVAHLMPLLDGSTPLHRVRAPVQSPVSRMDGCAGNRCSRSDLTLFVTFCQICASPGCSESGITSTACMPPPSFTAATPHGIQERLIQVGGVWDDEAPSSAKSPATTCH